MEPTTALHVLAGFSFTGKHEDVKPPEKQCDPNNNSEYNKCLGLVEGMSRRRKACDADDKEKRCADGSKEHAHFFGFLHMGMTMSSFVSVQQHESKI